MNVYRAPATEELFRQTITDHESELLHRFHAVMAKGLPEKKEKGETKEPKGPFYLSPSWLGESCVRKSWLRWHWCNIPVFDKRLLWLTNRGNLEEYRFESVFSLMKDTKISTRDLENKQHEVSFLDGWGNGKLDGTIRQLPDFKGTAWYDLTGVIEFKTFNKNQFNDLKNKSVGLAKPQHLLQMQIYMKEMRLGYALYCAICKDNDELYFELVFPKEPVAMARLYESFKNLHRLVMPKRLNNNPTFFCCKFCDFKEPCYKYQIVTPSCRNCSKFRFGERPEHSYCENGNGNYPYSYSPCVQYNPIDLRKIEYEKAPY